MSRLEELIAEYCPDGVEYKAIGSFANCYAGATPKTTKVEYWENGTIPWMSSGEVNQGEVLFTEKKITQAGYDNTSTKMVPPNTVVIALAGQGRTRGTVAITRISLCTNQSLCAIVVDETVISDYLLHFLRSQYQKLREVSSGDGTRGGLNLKMINNYLVPVPPLPVQCEIVRILDNFTERVVELQEQLTAELTARKKQYEYYRASLLNPSQNWKILQLTDLADISTGSSNTDEAEEAGIYPFYVRSQDPLSKNTYEYDEEAIITAGDGVGVGKVFHYVNGKYALHQRAYRIHPKSSLITGKYLYYYFISAFPHYITKQMFQGSVPSIRRPMLNKFEVPIPPISEQNHIVSILDRFDLLCNDISSGLPAEIEARQKQYEYYRDKLLTFKEKETPTI